MTFISTSLELVLARFSTALTQQRPRLLVVALAQPTGSLTGTATLSALLQLTQPPLRRVWASALQ